MKVLFLSQGREIEDHPGWDWALRKLREEGFIDAYLNIPWLGYGEKHGWDAFYNNVVHVVREGKFDVVYFHYFHNSHVPSPKNCIEALRKLTPRPVILTSSGDPFSDNWMFPDFPMNFKVASRFADITFSTEMGKAAEKMIRWGARNVVYTPNSMCPVRFKNYAIDFATHKFDFDVVMVGSRKKSGFNVCSQHYWATVKRTKLVYALDRHFGKRFGLFGLNWRGLQSNQGPIDFREQQHAYQRGRVIVGGNPYSHSDYYSSNRVFFEIASGIPTVELRVSRLDKVLRDNYHVYFADSIDGVIKKINDLLKMDPAVLYMRAAAAAKDIADRHTQYHRMKFKLDTAVRYIRNNYKLDVRFPFFLPEVDVQDESKFALRESMC